MIPILNRLGKKGDVLEYIILIILALIIGGLLFYIIKGAANAVFPK